MLEELTEAVIRELLSKVIACRHPRNSFLALHGLEKKHNQSEKTSSSIQIHLTLSHRQRSFHLCKDFIGIMRSPTTIPPNLSPILTTT